MDAVVKTETNEEWADVQRFIINRGGRWITGGTRVRIEGCRYGKDTCIRINNELQMYFGTLKHYEEDYKYYDIISFKTFMKLIREGKI